MTSSKIHTAIVGISTVVTIKESLTHQTCEELGKTFSHIINKSRNRIVLDFKSVSFLDSHGLELLLTMHDSLVSSGGSLKIFGLNGVCRDILIATRLINTLNVCGDLQEALRGEA